MSRKSRKSRMIVSKYTLSQLKIMVGFMERNPELCNPQEGSAQDRITSLEKWKSLTKTLNKDPSGCTKTMEKWKKVWADLKCKVKKKAASILRMSEQDNTGPNPFLNPIEERIVAMLAAHKNSDDAPENQDQEFNLVFVESSGLQLDQTGSQGLSTQPLDQYSPQLSPQSLPKSSPQSSPPSSPQPPPKKYSSYNPRARHRPPIQKHQASNPSHPRALKGESPSFNKTIDILVELEKSRLETDMLKEDYLHQREVERLNVESEKINNFGRLLGLMESGLPLFLQYLEE